MYSNLNMKSDLKEIQSTLKEMLNAQAPALRIRHDEAVKFEACGTKEVMQGKQKVDGHYFCLLYTSSSPRDRTRSRMPSSA